ncbi:hypothetical protein J6590_007985 [Homalodisca vitripennis]|nr:hypothetical protein J6590_007985 [Homalodisca vitripennis]
MAISHETLPALHDMGGIDYKKIFFCLNIIGFSRKELYWTVERPRTGQQRNYAALRRVCRERGTLFEDTDFPPCPRSLYKHKKPSVQPIVWMRPHYGDQSSEEDVTDATRRMCDGLDEASGFCRRQFTEVTVRKATDFIPPRLSGQFSSHRLVCPDPPAVIHPSSSSSDPLERY